MNGYSNHANPKHYDALRKACKAPRGWEMWQTWEDHLVRRLVEHDAYTVRDLATRLQRTENAILCRIEKRYGEQMRAHFTTFQRQYENGCPKPMPPDLDYPNPCREKWDWFQSWDFPPGWTTKYPPCTNMAMVDAMLGVNRIMDIKTTEVDDARIFEAAVLEISRFRANGVFGSDRWAYRVTMPEYRAIGREIERRSHFGLTITSNTTAPRSRYGNYYASITLLGVRLTRSAELAAIKDYGSSG